MAIRIKNWSKLQHFKDRTPPWIKLYRDLLDDPDWHDLKGDDGKLLIGLWLIASEDETHEGTLPSHRKLAFRLRISEAALEQALTRLSHWLIRDDIGVISDGHQLAAPETETEKRQREKPSNVPSWARKHSPEVVDATQRIFSIWPDKSRRQPNGESVPVSHSPILADRLTSIKSEGLSLTICVAIAERFLDEYENGGWLKAAENFFGIGTKEKPAPWKSYYKAHLTNEEVPNAS